MLDPDTVWTDYCYPEPCNFQGICINGTDGYTCDCYFDRAGDSCEIELDMCASADSECDLSEHGKCLYDDSPEGYGCYCDYGWEQEAGLDRMSACSVRNEMSLCDVYDCGGNGDCVEGVEDRDDVTCSCEMGWGGTNCQYRYKDVVNVQLLEMAAVLSEQNDDDTLLSNMAYNCAYTWPLSLDEAPMARSMAGMGDAEEISLCSCLRSYKEAPETTYMGLQETRLDPDYSYSVDELITLHCRDVSVPAKDVAEFRTSLIESNEACALALDNDELPLYLRNTAECDCLQAVAPDDETAQAMLDLPLDVTVPVAKAYYQWQTCTEEEICDFQDIYTAIKSRIAEYPSIARTCSPAVFALAKSTVASGEATIDFSDGMCSCITEVAKYCPTCGDEWFTCYAKSSDYRSLYQTFEESCTDTTKQYRTWAWSLQRIAFKYASVNLPDMSLCVSGMVTMLGRAAVPLGADERTQRLLCDCYSAVSVIDAEDGQLLMDGLNTLAPEGIDLTAETCESEYGAYSAPTPMPVTMTMEGDEVSTSSDSTWNEKKDITILIILCVLFALNILWLGYTCRTTEKSYFQLGPSRVNNRIQSKMNAAPIDAAGAQKYATTSVRS